MVYKQLTENWFGGKLLDKGFYEPVLKEAENHLKEIISAKLPIFEIARNEADLAEIEKFASYIKEKFSHLIILGTGGSSLCGAALVGLKQSQFSNPACRVTFLKSIDPFIFDEFLAQTNMATTAFLVISKSGETLETLAQFQATLPHAKNFWVITMPGENPLRNLAKENGIHIFDHDPKIGGRFSIFSLVGLMPALVAGIDVRALRKAAVDFLDNHAGLAAHSAAAHVAYMRSNYWQNVMMTYPDSLEDLNIWYGQIWAESLGKNGTGSTPIKAIGTIDQHSQMQLYLDGKKDKIYTIVTENPRTEGPEFNGKITLGDLVDAEQRATIKTLIDKGRPVRLIEMDEVNEETAGKLITHMMLETIITAKLLGVNPFDQPAVEAGKILAKKALKLIA